MKKSELAALIDKLMPPNLPQLVKSGRIVHFVPTDSILTGIVFTPIVRSKDMLDVDSFARPLYVPWEAPIIGSFSKPVRLGLLGLRTRWNIGEFESERAILQMSTALSRHIQALPSVSTPLQFAKKADRLFGFGRNHMTDFAIGLSYARAKEFSRASRFLQRVLTVAPPRSGMRVIIPQAAQVYEAFKLGNTSYIEDTLRRWEDDTINQLREVGLRFDRRVVQV